MLTTITSCGGIDKKPPPAFTTDTLRDDDTHIMNQSDTVSITDSSLPVTNNIPVYVDDTAAMVLKARLAADTSGKIADSVKEEIGKIQKYFRDKQRHSK